MQGEAVDQNYYCEAYRRFFLERQRELYDAVQIILRMRWQQERL